MIVTTIAAVRPMVRGTGWILVTADGAQYATRNAWHASVAERALLTRQRVMIWGGRGWYFEDLDDIRLEAPSEGDPRPA